MSDALEVQIRKARGQFAAMAASYASGTFNDNYYKQAVMLLAVMAGQTSFQAVAAAAFTLPFVLFAAPAGWMADRYPKRWVVIGAKVTELLAALVGAAGLLTGNLHLMVGMVGLMGLQSTFFSPALNGSIPELYPADHVTKANGVLRMLVTMAILLGTALAGIVLDRKGAPLLGATHGQGLLAISIVAIAVVGLVVSFGIPFRPAADPTRSFPWSGPVDTCKELARAWKDKLLANIILADVFIWALGVFQILAINPLGLTQYGFSPGKTSFLLAAQLVGLGGGGLLAGHLAKGERWHRVLVPAGLGTACCLLLLGAVPHAPQVLQIPALFVLLGLAGLTGGLFLVPCESFIQVRPAPERRGAVWASANFAAFLGMVVASVVFGLLAKTFKPTEIFGLLGVFALGFTLWLARALKR